MALNQSKVKSFRRCQKQYSFRHDYAPEGLELVPKYPTLPLKIGGWLHTCQQAFHAEWAGVKGADWEAVHDRLTHEFNQMFTEEKEQYGDLPGESDRLMRSYIRHLAKDQDRFEVATLKNGKPGIEFVVEVPLRKWGINDSFKGRIDLLVHDYDIRGLWIWDAKWVRKIPTPDERMMDPQRLMYVWALRKMGYDVRGFAHCYMRKKAPTVPILLKRGGRYGVAGMLTTKPSLDTDLLTYVRAMKAAHGSQWKMLAKTYYADKIRTLKAREETWFRRELSPVQPGMINQALGEFLATALDIEKRRTDDFVPRTYQYNCKFQCNYHDPCVAEFAGLDIEPLLKARFQYEEERYFGDEDEED